MYTPGGPHTPLPRVISAIFLRELPEIPTKRKNVLGRKEVRVRGAAMERVRAARGKGESDEGEG